MIVGERVEKLEVNVAKPPERPGFNMNFKIVDVKENDDLLDVTYEHTTKYTHGDAYIKIVGHLLFKEEENVKKEMLDTWNEKKRLPDTKMEQVLNTANYLATIYGTIASRIVNIAPPLLPIKLKLKR